MSVPSMAEFDLKLSFLIIRSSGNIFLLYLVDLTVPGKKKSQVVMKMRILLQMYWFYSADDPSLKKVIEHAKVREII